MIQSQFLFASRFVHFAVLAAIIGMAAALRLYLFSGYGGFDDAEYASIAYRIANGTFLLAEYGGPPVFPLRVGVVLPAAIGFRVFGLSEWSMVLYPLALSILALPLVYICAATLFSHRAGLIAAALLGIVPMELGSATKLLPDMPSAFYAALGVTVICLVTRATGGRRSVLFWGGVLAGIAFGISWLCKEAIAFLAPFCLVFMIISLKRDVKAGALLWAGVAAGAFGVLLAEMTFYRALTGDFLFRFHEIERNYRQLENGFFTEGSDFGWQKGESYARALMKRLFISGPALLLLQFEFMLLPLIGLVACLHGWYWKDRSFVVPSLWLVTVLLMFNFSSTSSASYMPLALFHRYFYLIVFPSVVLAAGLIGKLLFSGAASSSQDLHGERRFWGLMLACAILLMGAYLAQGSLRSSPSAWAMEVRSLGSMIKPSSPLYTDTLSIRGLAFFAGFPGKTAWTDFAHVESQDDIRPGSLVLVNKAYIEWLNKNGGMWLSPRSGYRKHSFYEAPPPSWKKIWQSDSARLYRVD
jgi:4-amino-4-deoxy-L-arabinose transferase-like glycosyltransferase